MKKLLFTIPLLFALVACNNESPELPGVFSVDRHKQIQFSPGLLQYRASTNTWRFAKSQLEFIGEDNLKISPTYNGWIDLFGYGCTGYDDKYPWQTSTNREDYAPSFDGGIIGMEYDWGVHCDIQNGGPKGGWRLPTTDDWYCILSYRDNAENLSTLTYIDTLKGILILPDGWENTDGLDLHFVKGGIMTRGQKVIEKNHLTKQQWKKLEASGAVFIPFSGERRWRGKELVYTSQYAILWTSICLCDNCQPWVAGSLTNSKEDAVTFGDTKVYYGLAVRLVKDVK